MSDGAATRVYGQALFETASAGDLVSAVGADIEQFLDAMRQIPELDDFLRTPLIPDRGKREVIEQICEEAAPESVNFLKLLVDRGRIEALEAICLHFAELADEKAHRVPVLVASARKLTQEAVGRIARAVRARTGAEPVMRFKIDPALLGGVVIRAGDRLLDGSLAARLETVRRHLLRAKGMEALWEGEVDEWVDGAFPAAEVKG